MILTVGHHRSIVLSSTGLAALALDESHLSLKDFLALEAEDRALVAEHLLGDWLAEIEARLDETITFVALERIGGADGAPTAGDEQTMHDFDVAIGDATFVCRFLASAGSDLDLALSRIEPDDERPREILAAGLDLGPAAAKSGEAASHDAARVAIGPIVLAADDAEALAVGDLVALIDSDFVSGCLSIGPRTLPVTMGETSVTVLPAFRDAARAPVADGQIKLWMEFARATVAEDAPPPGSQLAFERFADGEVILRLDGLGFDVARGHLVDADGDIGLEIEWVRTAPWA